MRDLLTPYIPSRQLRSSSKNLLFITRTYSARTYSARSFSVVAPTFWNTLPSEEFVIESNEKGGERRNKHVEADEKQNLRQEVVDCGTKRAQKADTSETAKCVICNEDDVSHLYSFCTLKTDKNLRLLPAIYKTVWSFKKIWWRCDCYRGEIVSYALSN